MKSDTHIVTLPITIAHGTIAHGRHSVLTLEHFQFVFITELVTYGEFNADDPSLIVSRTFIGKSFGYQDGYPSNLPVARYNLPARNLHPNHRSNIEL